ncbi:acetyltransferase [Phormidium sp. LEGE 05292]|uniref:acetyltransferase n=1 Tax=[Phormidium] sp. LEGE 05292 TaxID=767427 RepID=UPI00187ED43C|nr:acetyltransferase [Phormidium sp. LEGE 05292]MBE9225609.1 acetyltransferase [Phormidium sp. LEGE 05292]
MFLKQKQTGDLIEVLVLADLYNPCKTEILGQSHSGEEMQDPEIFPKSELIFPSGEPLPVCWIDSHYNEIPPRPVALMATP